MRAVGAAKLLLRLRLYVAGEAPNSLRARANLRKICDEHFASKYELEVIDVLEHPMRALADGVVVTPMLLKLSPPPTRKIVGDLSDTDHVVRVLVPRGEG